MSINCQKAIFSAIVWVCAIAALVGLLVYQSGRFRQQKLAAQRAALLDQLKGRSGEYNIRESDGLVPRDFFTAPEAIGACQAIADRDQAQLQALIVAGLDVNLTGHAGMTLLHWAYVCDNFEAFDLLLKSGADPNKKLTRSVLFRTKNFAAGDSILFTSLRQAWKRSQLDFFYAAMKHTRETDPRDYAGNTLLLFVLRERKPDKAILARIINFGVDLDAQTEHGDTAATLAAWDRPQLALQILKAGADPSIRNSQGRSVADLVQIKLEPKKHNRDYPKADAMQLLEWLQEHGPSDEKCAWVLNVEM